MSMLKTGPCFKSSKPTKRDIDITIQNNLTLFLIKKAKELFQKLKKVSYKKSVLQHFDVSKPIRVETDASGKAIEGILWQQDTNKKWHPVAYYLYKMQSAKLNYETHNAELLAIVKSFKIWHHYLEKATYTILVLTDHNNLKKFIKTTCLSGR